MPLPEQNLDGDFSDPERAERMYREALIRNARDKADYIDSLAKGLVAATVQKNRKPFLCRLLGC